MTPPKKKCAGPPPRRRGAPVTGSERGTALVLVLSALVLITILITAFVFSMRTEMASSGAVETAQRTKLVAQGALSHAIDILRSNIPDPVAVDDRAANDQVVNWVTNPGRLTLISQSGQLRHIPLHTGVAPDPGEDLVPDARSVDLNRPLAGSPRPAIVSYPGNEGEDGERDRPEMRVAWQPVLEFPGLPAGAGNKLAGRYAFWVDDECAKVNMSVALGKPAPSSGLAGSNMREELRKGIVRPQFTSFETRGGRNPSFSLGHPSSINVDVLFEKPEDAGLPLLHGHQFVHGFMRYPDMVLSFINLRGTEARDWYDENLWYMTVYNRSPEFNVFGKSRLFTIGKPVSLDGGPACQMPFIVQGRDTLQSSAILGHFPRANPVNQGNAGGNGGVDDPFMMAKLSGFNHVNLMTGRTLLDYFERNDWPGYEGMSLKDKYGPRETIQMILNMLLMGRLATTDPVPYPELVTSLHYVPETGPDDDSGEDSKFTIPARYCWRLDDDFQISDTREPMLPQMPGPHLNEIKFVIMPEEFEDADGNRKFYLKYRYEVEYYMHPHGPNVGGEDFPTKVDYLKIHVKSNGRQSEHTQEFAQDSWDSPNLSKLATMLPPNERLRPTRPDGYRAHNFKVASSRAFYLTSSGDIIEGGDRVVFDPGEATVRVNLRLGLAGHGPIPKQLIPMDRIASDLNATFGTFDALDTLDTLDRAGDRFTVDLGSGEPEFYVSWQVEDPRVSRSKRDWEPHQSEGFDTMGSPNTNQDPNEFQSDDFSKFKYIEPGPGQGGGDEYSPLTRFPSIGYWSLIHKGIQSGTPWKTLSLDSTTAGSPPDWLLLDLMGATFPDRRAQWASAGSLPDTWSAVSYLNATAGKVNINGKVYPEDEHFNPPPRTESIKAVFRHMRPDMEIEDFAEEVFKYQETNEVFDYVGELAEVAGYAKGSTSWEKESFLRNMASCLTTQSNTFGVWGIAQTVRKATRNVTFDQFEPGDSVLGEKRFFALVERHVWPGKDGVPGNAHVDSDGMWDRNAGPPPEDEGGPADRPTNLPGLAPMLGEKWEFAEIDGPTPVHLAGVEDPLAQLPYRQTSLEEAYNPADPVMKYRILYFKYLDH